jgi:hypothetical protein
VTDRGVPLTRGRYRSIAVALVEGPDFQRLSPEARLVFLVLKITLGPTGIETSYSDAQQVELKHRTGLTGAKVDGALKELASGNWIRREANVLWVIRQLEFEPNYTVSNAKHRVAVQSHVNGLPHLPIVDDYRALYRRWFDTPVPTEGSSGEPGKAIDSPTIPYDRAIEASVGAGAGCPEGLFPSDARAGCSIEFDAAFAIYPKRAGSNPKRGAERAWTARIRESVKAAEMYAGVERYRAFTDAEHAADPASGTGTRFVMQASKFFGPDAHYAEAWTVPVSQVSRSAADIDEATRRHNRERERELGISDSLPNHATMSGVA